MKWMYTFCLVNVVVIFILAALIAISTGSSTDYLAFTGILSFVWSVLCIVIGLVLFLFRRRQWGRAFLLTAGVLLLLGFMECSVSYIG